MSWYSNPTPLPYLYQSSWYFNFIPSNFPSPKHLLPSCLMENAATPKPGEWPVDPQNDVKISDHRIWVDGCFDFAHHGLLPRPIQVLPTSESSLESGHAGAMLQARRLGKELLVGIHSDQEIMDNKGPTVMTLKERSVPLRIISRR